MEVAAFIVSIISLLVSISICVMQNKNDKNINDINLEAELSKEIFKEYLTKKFPQAINHICFENGRLSNIDTLQNELNSLRRELKFFKYSDGVFFDELKEKSQNLEDYIVNNEGKTFDFDGQANVIDFIVASISNIYSIIKSKYKNG